MLTTTQAAAALGITRRAVRQHIERGNIKAERFGRALAISEDEIERFKRERRSPKAGRPRKEGK